MINVVFTFDHILHFSKPKWPGKPIVQWHLGTYEGSDRSKADGGRVQSIAVSKWQMMSRDRSTLLVVTSQSRTARATEMVFIWHKKTWIKKLLSCDHDHWQRYGSLVFEQWRKCLWAQRVLFGWYKDMWPCGDGSFYHHLCHAAPCICLKTEEQQWPHIKKQVFVYILTLFKVQKRERLTSFPVTSNLRQLCCTKRKSKAVLSHPTQ